MILVIDNYDIFTWNLVHYLQEPGAAVEVVRNDAISAGQALSSGAEAFLYARQNEGDPHKLIFGTNNVYLLPLSPSWPIRSGSSAVAALALDEFLVCVKADSPDFLADD